MPEGKDKPIYGEGQNPPWVKEVQIPGWMTGKWRGFSVPVPWTSKVLVGISSALSPYDRKITREHEFVHAGQQRPGTNMPSYQTTMDLLFGKGKEAGQVKEVAKKQLSSLGYPSFEDVIKYEAPAYSMEDGYGFSLYDNASGKEVQSVFSQTKEQDLFNYLNEMRRLNPENYASIETTIPDWLHRRYIESSPMPLMPVIRPRGVDYGKVTAEALNSFLSRIGLGGK